MKIKILAIFLFVSAFGVTAQSKAGAVDIEIILNNLPEMTKVNENLQIYAAQLDLDFQKKMDAYEDAIEAYRKEEKNLNENDKKQKQMALIEMENDIQKFRQNGAALLELKQQEYLRPLYTKIEVALEKVAKAGKFTQVVQITPEMLYLEPAYNLTTALAKELGITLKEE